MATVAERFGDEGWFEQREDSEASRVFRAMEDIPVAGSLTYDDLDRILGRDFKANRQPWNNALRRWHRDRPNEGTWVNVQRVGYQRVAEWVDVKATGQAHEKRMRKQASKSKDRYRSADPALMTDDQKREHTELLVRVGKLEQAMRSTKKEITLLKRTKANTTDVDDLRQQVAELSAKLDGL
jgi:hypothetical protein